MVTPESAPGDCHAQHPCWSWQSLVPSPGGVPSWDGLRRLSRRMWGAQESANQEHGAWFLGSWAPLRGRRSPPLLPSAPPSLAPQNRVRGRGMKRPRARETGREFGRKKVRWGTPTAFSSLWRSSSPAPVACKQGRGLGRLGAQRGRNRWDVSRYCVKLWRPSRGGRNVRRRAGVLCARKRGPILGGNMAPNTAPLGYRGSEMSLSGSGVPDPRHGAQHATVGFRRLGAATPSTRFEAIPSA
jgi:hypothetical protein